MAVRIQKRPLTLKNRTRARGGRCSLDPRRACRVKRRTCIELAASCTKNRVRLESFSQDPIGFNAGDVNLYRYVGNGPTNDTDPSGLKEYNGPSMEAAPPWYVDWWNKYRARLAKRDAIITDPRASQTFAFGEQVYVAPSWSGNEGWLYWFGGNLWHRTPVGDACESGARLITNPRKESAAIAHDIYRGMTNIHRLPEAWEELPAYQKQDAGINTLIGIAIARPYVRNLWPRRVIVKPNKWDYFFGRVTSSRHNTNRSMQIARDLERFGVRESLDGRGALLEIFEAGRHLPECSRYTTQFGTTITRRFELPEVGGIDIKYFYPGGNLKAKPEIPTIIPKIYK